jgi:hypothetical protein
MFWVFALLFVVLCGVASVTAYSLWGFVAILVAFALATLFARLLRGRDDPS